LQKGLMGLRFSLPATVRTMGSKYPRSPFL
jgi:hypothetical protein